VSACVALLIIHNLMLPSACPCALQARVITRRASIAI
jgi:hypothetical protein